MTGDSAQPVRLAPRGSETVQLTRTQALIWASQRLHSDVPLANMGNRFRIAGAIDPDRFVQTFDRLVRACDVLRCVVLDSASADRVEARILVDPPQRTVVIEMAPDALEEWSAQRIATPIDATRCVYDSVLIRHDDDDWTWWLDIHHIATDARSSALLFEAMSTIYEADHEDAVGLDELIDGRFFEFIARAAEKLGEAKRESPADRAEAWANDAAAAGAQPPLALYGPRGPRATSVERLPLPLPASSMAQLESVLTSEYRTISRELGVLAISAMSMALAVHRLDGRSSVVLGVPVHHRSSRGASTVIGPLMELYPLTVGVDPGETNAEMFQRVLRSIMTLLARAKPGESPETSFEIVLKVLTTRFGTFAGIPTERAWMRSGHVEPNHVIRSQVFDDGGFVWELDLNTSLDDGGAASRLPLHIAAVVEGVIGGADRLVMSTPIVNSDEVTELALLNPDPVAREHTIPVHEQIRGVLRRTPDWIVAECGDDVIAADDFDRRADEVAAWLVRAGMQRGRPVGLRMARSIDVLIAIHGVLRAGGAFVMLSPDDPAARHAAMITDADLMLILDELPDTADVGPVDLEELPTVSLDDLAYILYTSGSTGEPKGVPISHRGLADYIEFALDAYVDPSEPPPVIPLHSALVFDLTVTSLFLSMVAGGRVVVFPQDPIDALAAIASDDRISLLKATPSQLELFSRLATDGRPLRTVIVGGEAFRRPVAERLAAVCAEGVRIFNEYGPTEAVVGCMVHEWNPANDLDADVPIGHASPGAVLAVLDQGGQLTAPGAWGELYVQRPGMATGYLNRPAMTAERFVTNPMLDGVSPGAWYRSGDRARVVRPGVLTFGGRIDDQLKVNGIRLEPAEVETALVSHPRIDTALARIWHAGEGNVALSESTRCVRCGLGADVPNVTLDAQRVCSVCRSFEVVEPQTGEWFRNEADLDAERDRARSRATGDIDCLHLLSGGKDSTYALYQLVERGWRVHALTLDNGFIAEGAKENVRRSIADLGITHEFVTTDAMNEIFRDSLDRYSNVCQGCYKTIYTFAVARAKEMGIPVIVTGLSRGQFFETRLVPHQFEQGRFDPDEIDATVLEARRVYHHTADAVTELLPEQRVFDDDSIFEQVEFLDYYRYVDVDLAELYRFLEERAPWVRPADTGRSTNCLINVAGIQVHRAERGFHNYAEPYSWDVRLGHKTRHEALEELDDEVDDAEVVRLLAEVGYEPKINGVLTAWYQSTDGLDVDPDELRRHMRERLPDHAVPAAFVRIDEMPMAASAKADPSLLPAPTRFHRRGADRVEPNNPIERRLCEIWAELLSLEAVGVTDDFFDLGGASLSALEVVAAVDVEFGTDLPDAAVFRARSIRELSVMVALAVDTGERSSTRAIERLDPDDSPPLSAGEEAMLFDYRVDPTNPRYNVTRWYTLRTGPDGSDTGYQIDADRLGAAFRAVVMLHPTLHTTYSIDRRALNVEQAVAIQVVAPMARDDFERFAGGQRGVPFDLDAGPLVRVHLCVTGPTELSMLIAMHHVSVDAGTFDTLWAQVARYYADSSLPELPVSYAEHTAWQRSQLSDADADFWRGRAAERQDTLPLGLSAPRIAGPDGYLSRRTDLDPAALSTRGSTPFAAAMAATAVVLSRFTGAAHVEFGITASTKEHVDAADLVGYYLNTLPMGFDVRPDESFGALLQQASSRVAEALPHRGYPFGAMVRDARAAGVAVPDISFMLAYEELATPEFPGAAASQQILASGVSVTDVTFFVQERASSVQLGLEYRGTVIDEVGAERMMDLFETVLRMGVRDPASAIAALVAGETADDLRGAPLARTDRTVIDAFTDQVEATPAHRAVIDEHGAELSYVELASAALDLAEEIEHLAGRGGRVGVAVERSAEVLVAALGVQISGCAYVPLDPSVPPARLEHIAQIAQIDVLVTTDAVRASGLVERIGTPADRVVIVDQSRRGGLGRTPVEHLRRRAVAIDADDPAYVIFTSGSTGTQRGVEVTHRNLAASTFARDDWYDSSPDRFLVTSGIGFDSSIVGLFWPLVTGGTIVMPDDDTVHDVDRLGALVEHLDVTHTLMVPSLYRALLQRAASRLGGLAVAIVAGEACPRGVVELHETFLPDCVLVNEYGPTEATVWATAHRLTTDDDVVPIGGPVPGTLLRVVDRSLHSVARGVAGELLVAGPGVTAGYLGDPVATADRFVTLDDAMWYCTGDLVRVVDGIAHFLGRIDDQLNVGGNRLEPGDVETVLRGWHGVDEAVVVAAGDPAILVAHLEGAQLGSGGFDDRALRAELGANLPAGAIPRRFIVHERLPRNANGKIDRAAAALLPVSQHAASGPPAAEPVDVSTELLSMVLGAWIAALGRDDLIPSTDFFEVGGDSLSAIEIVSELGDRLGRVVPIAALLAGRTPAGMAALLDEAGVAMESGGEEATVAISPSGTQCRLVVLRSGTPTGPVVVMTPGWDDVFGYQALANAFDDRVRVTALIYSEQPDTRTITTVDELLDHFAPLAHADIASRSEVALLGWSVGGVVAAELAQRLAALGVDVDALALIDTYFPGEEQYLWSNRWWKYKSMFRPGAVGEIGKEVSRTVTRRAQQMGDRLGRSLLAWSGTEVPDQTERTSVGGFPIDALAHRLEPIRTPVVFYAASTTNPDRTWRRWEEIADSIVHVEIAGRHRGFDSIMAAPGVDRIAVDLARRL